MVNRLKQPFGNILQSLARWVKEFANMRTCLAIVLAVLGLMPIWGRAQAVITNTVLGVRTEFITDALLTDEEVKAVVALAKDCGFEEVAVVRTFHFLPTLQRGIEATSKDQIAGRTITYQTVVIYREGWSEQLKPTGPLRTISNGSFWVENLILKNHELTLFNTSKGVVRVELGHDVSLVEADKVIDALTCGRIHFADDFVKGRYRGIDFAHPSRLKKGDQTGEFSVSFSDGMAEFGLELSGKDVTILGETFATP